jgi:hypothetical protein
LDKIPVAEYPRPEYETRKRTLGVEEDLNANANPKSVDQDVSVSQVEFFKIDCALQILLGLSNLGGAVPNSTTGVSGGSGVMDLMADIFGGGAVEASSTSAVTKPANDTLLDLLGSSPPKPTSVIPTAKQSKLYPVLNKDGLRITMTASIDASNPTVLNVQSHFYNDGIGGGSPITDFSFQAAVPKVFSSFDLK